MFELNFIPQILQHAHDSSYLHFISPDVHVIEIDTHD